MIDELGPSRTEAEYIGLGSCLILYMSAQSSKSDRILYLQQVFVASSQSLIGYYCKVFVDIQASLISIEKREKRMGEEEGLSVGRHIESRPSHVALYLGSKGVTFRVKVSPVSLMTFTTDRCRRISTVPMRSAWRLVLGTYSRSWTGVAEPK